MDETAEEDIRDATFVHAILHNRHLQAKLLASPDLLTDEHFDLYKKSCERFHTARSGMPLNQRSMRIVSLFNELQLHTRMVAAATKCITRRSARAVLSSDGFVTGLVFHGDSDVVAEMKSPVPIDPLAAININFDDVTRYTRSTPDLQRLAHRDVTVVCNHFGQPENELLCHPACPPWVFEAWHTCQEVFQKCERLSTNFTLDVHDVRRALADEWAAVEHEFGGEEKQLALVEKVRDSFPVGLTDRAALGATAACVVLARKYSTTHAYGTKISRLNTVLGYQSVVTLLEKVNCIATRMMCTHSGFRSAATFEALLILRTQDPRPTVNAIFLEWVRFDPSCGRRKYLGTCWTFCNVLDDVCNLSDEDTKAPALSAVIDCLSLANRVQVFEMPSMYAATVGKPPYTSIRPLRVECENVVKRAIVVGRVIAVAGRIIGVLPIGKKSVRVDTPRFANITDATITVSRLRMIGADLASHVGHEVPFHVRFLTGSSVVRAVFAGGVCCTCGQRLPDVAKVSHAVSRGTQPTSAVQFDEDETATDSPDHEVLQVDGDDGD